MLKFSFKTISRPIIFNDRMQDAPNLGLLSPKKSENGLFFEQHPEKTLQKLTVTGMCNP